MRFERGIRAELTIPALERAIQLLLQVAGGQAAIDACHAAGGGRVVCPPGIYLVGTLEIKSNVDLHVEAGATLRGSTDQADYRPLGPAARADGLRHNAMHLIFAYNADNVALTGRGAVDGQGDAFFGPRLPGSSHLSLKGWRPPQLIAFINCRDVLVDSITLRNPPGWTLWPLGCDRVRIHGIRILTNRWGPNTDGIDPDCCRGVQISDCHLDCGDGRLPVAVGADLVRPRRGHRGRRE
jgi:polygalacturonase